MCFRGCRRCRPFRRRIHRGNSHERPPCRAGAGTDHHRLRRHRRQPLNATCRVPQGCDTVRRLGQHALSPSDLPRLAGTQGGTHRHPHPRTDLYPAGKHRKVVVQLRRRHPLRHRGFTPCPRLWPLPRRGQDGGLHRSCPGLDRPQPTKASTACRASSKNCAR